MHSTSVKEYQTTVLKQFHSQLEESCKLTVLLKSHLQLENSGQEHKDGKLHRVYRDRENSHKHTKH